MQHMERGTSPEGSTDQTSTTSQVWSGVINRRQRVKSSSVNVGFQSAILALITPRVALSGRIAQLVRASGLHPEGRGFESLFAHP